MPIKIKRNTREVEEIPLSSTADIAFLLIVFFLAVSALLELRGIKVPLPKPDAPPMQIEKKNIFRVEVVRDGRYRYEKAVKTLDEVQTIMRDAAAQNPAIVIVLRVDPRAPSEVVPAFVQRVQEEKLRRISIGMETIR
jgi:biopolymer transport protein ExbD